MDAQQSAVSGSRHVSVRRNGSSAACEPCRVRKLACDHSRPVCGRCQRRGKPDLCSYHPAPMVGLKRRARQPKPAGPPSQLATPSTASDESPVLETTPLSQEAHQCTSIAPEGNGPGYLGSTSFYSSIGESRRELERDGPLRDTRGMLLESVEMIAKAVPTADLEAGAKVLTSFYPCEVVDELIQKAYSHSCAPQSPEPVVKCCWESLRAMLAPIEHSEQRHQRLLELSRLIFCNTSTALPLPGSNASMRTWAATFSGSKTRWESIGIITNCLGLEILGLKDREPEKRLSVASDAIGTARWLCTAISRVLGFCDDMNVINDLTLWMMLDSSCFVSCIYGDDSFVTWKRAGDLSSGIFAMGFHSSVSHLSNPRSPIPLWLVQIRKHITYSAYHLDLKLSMFVGRPPRLTSRYCTFGALPLELTMKELALEPHELEEVVARSLNEQGERITMTVSEADRGARLRASHALCLEREQVLELCLGTPREGETRAHVEAMVQKSEQVWRDRREKFQYDPEVWKRCQIVGGALTLLSMHLDHLYHDFLLQRVLVQRYQAGPERLLILADELLTNSLLLLGREDHIIVEWVISLYSLPSAGVLALELLQRQTHGQPRPTAQSPPRSRIVQNLSVLVAALKWTSHEGIGNYSLGRQAMSTLERVLDRVLNTDCTRWTPPEQTRQPTNVLNHNAAQQQEYRSAVVDTTDHTYGINNGHANVAADFSLAGMESLPSIGQMDFDEAFWLGLQEHPLLDTRAINFGTIGADNYA